MEGPRQNHRRLFVDHTKLGVPLVHPWVDNHGLSPVQEALWGYLLAPSITAGPIVGCGPLLNKGTTEVKKKEKIFLLALSGSHCQIMDVVRRMRTRGQHRRPHHYLPDQAVNRCLVQSGWLTGLLTGPGLCSRLCSRLAGWLPLASWRNLFLAV